MANKPQNKYQKSIDLLNDAIGKEIATSLQYMYFHVHFEDAGYQYLARMMHQISIAEMRHIEIFAERIIYLQGDVNMNASFQTRQILDVKEALEFCVALEQSTIEEYNVASHACAVHADAVSHKVFQNAIEEEEHHHDLFRTEVQNMIDYGVEYLALQSIAGSAAQK
ncbi:MAG: ferritin-like domain-containing protein [Alistipes sp.]